CGSRSVAGASRWPTGRPGLFGAHHRESAPTEKSYQVRDPLTSRRLRLQACDNDRIVGRKGASSSLTSRLGVPGCGRLGSRRGDGDQAKWSGAGADPAPDTELRGARQDQCTITVLTVTISFPDSSRPK